MRLSYGNRDGFQCYFKIKFKEGQKNIESGEKYRQENEKKRSCRLNYRLQVHERLRIGGQVEYSYYTSDSSKSSGVLLFHEIKHTVDKITYGPRITLFSVDDYNARIYVYEPSLKFSSPFTFFKDKGVSFSVKLKYPVPKRYPKT